MYRRRWRSPSRSQPKLEQMKLGRSPALVRSGIHETLAFYEFPSEHWRCLRTVEEGATVPVMTALQEVVERKGVFCALCSDRGSHSWLNAEGRRSG
jgi:hypothetical protein